jgi:hydrogenase nickel incorporation protein HypB
MTTRVLELRQGVLAKNDRLADDLRRQFAAAGVRVANLVSSPGAGKTALLERTLAELGRQHRVAALVGDLATANDAARLARSGAPVRQIVTDGICHLEADMVARHLEGWDLAELDYLFIENVGNLVCPAGFDLGEGLRVVLVSVTEGEDKPLKYPTAFQPADLAVITKIDLADAVDFDRPALYAAIAAVRPGLPVIETSARSGAGFEAWLAALAAIPVPARPATQTEE